MPKQIQARIGDRDIEILTALDRCPLTPSQLRKLSATFQQPFKDEHNLRRRLRVLAASGLIRSWIYATATDGRSPRYFKLTRDGYRLLYGMDAPIPRRRYFEAISPGHHHHTKCLGDFIVHLLVSLNERGACLQQFARENSVKLEANGFTLYPDAAFSIIDPQSNRSFNFVVELDNGTERIRSKQDVESIERKVRGYDAHQSQFSTFDADRYLVIFITTRSEQRLKNILDVADMVMTNRQRTVFIGTDLSTWLTCDPLKDAVLIDHRGLKRTTIPMTNVRKDSSTEIDACASVIQR